jgi:hypothetical protein
MGLECAPVVAAVAISGNNFPFELAATHRERGSSTQFARPWRESCSNFERDRETVMHPGYFFAGAIIMRWPAVVILLVFLCWRLDAV